MHQTQDLTGFGFVVRVENLGDGFGLSLFSLGVDVTTSVENVPVEEFGGAGFPQTQDVDGLTLITDNRDIPWQTLDLLTGVPHLLHLAIFAKYGFNITVQRDFLSRFWTADFPWVAVLAPGVWALDLTTVADFLTEQTVFVVNAVTDSRHVQSSQRVDEASSQTTQTTVTQRHVWLFFTQIGDVDAQILESLAAHFVQREVMQVVGSQTAHQELGRQVVDCAGVFLEVGLLGLSQTLKHQFVYCSAGRLPPGLSARLLLAGPQRGAQVVNDILLQLLFIQGAELFNFFLRHNRFPSLLESSEPNFRLPGVNYKGCRSGSRILTKGLTPKYNPGHIFFW